MGGASSSLNGSAEEENKKNERRYVRDVVHRPPGWSSCTNSSVDHPLLQLQLYPDDIEGEDVWIRVLDETHVKIYETNGVAKNYASNRHFSIRGVTVNDNHMILLRYATFDGTEELVTQITCNKTGDGIIEVPANGSFVRGLPPPFTPFSQISTVRTTHGTTFWSYDQEEGPDIKLCIYFPDPRIRLVCEKFRKLLEPVMVSYLLKPLFLIVLDFLFSVLPSNDN